MKCIACGGSSDGTPSGIKKHAATAKHQLAVATAVKARIGTINTGSSESAQAIRNNRAEAASVATATVVPADATPTNRPDLFGTRGQLRPDGDGGISSAMVNDRPEYATPQDSGIESGFYVGERGLPWHVTLSRQLGEADLMADAGRLLTTAEALPLAGQDYTVSARPMVIAGTDVLVPNRLATVRDDTGAPLGIVSPRYQIVQNEEAFAFADNLVDSGEAKWETAGVLRNGAHTFISMELDHLEIEVPGDSGSLKTYLLVVNSHDGSHPLEGHITQVRTVCRNTAKLAKKNALTSFRLRHTSGLEGKLATAREALGISFKNAEAVREITGVLAGTSLLDKQVREIFENAIFQMDPELGDAAKEKHKATLAFQNYLSSPTLEGIRGTAWGALNAVTEFLDHETGYKSRVAGIDEGDARFENLTYGGAAETKDRALAVLLKASR
jgi:phage/plasmid-like protein (TIGR03299 family)